jgi:hypothetical protein
MIDMNIHYLLSLTSPQRKRQIACEFWTLLYLCKNQDKGKEDKTDRPDSEDLSQKWQY